MILGLKNLFKNIQKPRFIRVGSCKKCGECCRNITFKIQDKFINDPEKFEKLKIWQPKYHHFYISGKDENGDLLFTCKSLNNDNLCENYKSRSLYCRLFPRIKSRHIAEGAQTLEKCGYYYKSSVEFKEFLKPNQLELLNR